jgi:hypothetical protein
MSRFDYEKSLLESFEQREICPNLPFFARRLVNSNSSKKTVLRIPAEKKYLANVVLDYKSIMKS